MLCTPPPIHLKALERKGNNSTNFVEFLLIFFLAQVMSIGWVDNMTWAKGISRIWF